RCGLDARALQRPARQGGERAAQGDDALTFERVGTHTLTFRCWRPGGRSRRGAAARALRETRAPQPQGPRAWRAWRPALRAAGGRPPPAAGWARPAPSPWRWG